MYFLIYKFNFVCTALFWKFFCDRRSTSLLHLPFQIYTNINCRGPNIFSKHSTPQGNRSSDDNVLKDLSVGSSLEAMESFALVGIEILIYHTFYDIKIYMIYTCYITCSLFCCDTHIGFCPLCDVTCKVTHVEVNISS